MTGNGGLSKNELLQHLPHRPPFLFVDEVIEIVLGESILAVKHVRVDEEYFKGHFPAEPIMPGVLIIEALAQASCILYDISIPALIPRAYYLTSEKFKFLKSVIPPCDLRLISRAVKLIAQGGMFKVRATINEEVVAEGEMTFACKSRN